MYLNIHSEKKLKSAGERRKIQFVKESIKKKKKKEVGKAVVWAPLAACICSPLHLQNYQITMLIGKLLPGILSHIYMLVTRYGKNYLK